MRSHPVRLATLSILLISGMHAQHGAANGEWRKFGPRPNYNWETTGSGWFNASPGAGGKMFRAIDKKTGAIVHEMALPASTTGVPMTYLIDDKQYMVVATGAR